MYAVQVMAEVGGMCERRSGREAVCEVSDAEVDATGDGGSRWCER